ncbi:MAG: DUF3987 domain-containing protein [Phycisphaerales bacterium]|nr:MAG: DUF3987 domain-containing protein [Phycisphaerales bacterium]
MSSTQPYPKPAGPRATDTGAYRDPQRSPSAADPVEEVLSRLPGAKKTHKGWFACCPAHDDRNPSLSISVGDDGRVLLHCHAGCTPDAIVAAVRLTLADLYPPSLSGKASAPSRNRKPKDIYASPDEVIEGLLRVPELRGGDVMRYSYHCADSSLAFVVLRFDFADDREKTFRPIHPIGDGWAVGDPPGKLPLYGLPELNGADCVYVCEGEKAVHAARTIGLCATTSAHGAKSAQNTDWAPLAGKTVIILCDNDAPGRKYARTVALILVGLGCKVKIVDLARHFDLPAGGDIADWIDAHDSRTSDDLRRMLEEIAKQTPYCRPAQAAAKGVLPRWRSFPVRLLPEPLRSCIAEGAAAMGCDPAMIALPVLAVCAGCVGVARAIRLKGIWPEPCVLWSVVVAESGTLKSPALDYATKALRHLQAKRFQAYSAAVAEYESAMLRYEADKSDWRKKRDRGEPPTKPEVPTFERYVVTDVTVEAAAPILAENPRGVLLVRDELGGWLHGFNQYKGGRGSDVANWAEAHRAGPWTVDRKTGTRTIHVPRAAVSVCGTIQPGTLERALTPEFFECGLAARLLFAAPPRRQKKWTDAEVSPDVIERYARTLEQLLTLQHDLDDSGNPTPREVPLSAQAREVWIAWYNTFAQRQAEASGHRASALAKIEGYAPRFALLFHLVRWAALPDADEGPIESWAIEAGTRLAEWFADEAERVYGLLGENDAEREDRRLIEFVERKGGAVTVRDAVTGCRWLRTADEARAALQRLVDAGLGYWERPKPGPKGGQPSELFRLISHPEICDTPAQEHASGGIADADAADGVQNAKGEMEA